MKLLGILWALSTLYLLYGVYGNLLMICMYPDSASYMRKLGVFFGVAAVLSMGVAAGMFRPQKPLWFLALLLCPGIGWYFLSILPRVLLHFSLSGVFMALSYLSLYAVTFVYLLCPTPRTLFGISRATLDTARPR